MKSLILGAMMLILSSGLAFAQGSQAMPLEMDGTEWVLTLSQDGSDKTSSDTLVFADKKFISANFDKQKYEPTNYTLSVKDDGSTTFDTMQSKGDDIVMWHGMITNDGLRGVMSVHLANGKVSDYTFSGTLTSGVLRLREPAVVVSQEEPSQPAEEAAE